MELTIEMRVKPGKFQELYQSLQALLPTIRKAKGCSGSRIWRDVEDGEVFFLSAQWQTPAEFEHYMRSAGGAALLGALDLLSETAKVRLGRNSPWERIDTLKGVRKKPWSPTPEPWKGEGE